MDSIQSDLALETFYEIWNKIIQNCVPKFKTFNNSKLFPSWYTQEIKDLIKNKNKFRKLQNISNYYLEKYKESRRALKYLIKIEENKYLKEVQQNVEGNINYFWNYIKNKKSNCTHAGNFVYLGQNVDGENTAEVFAKFFASTYNSDKATYNLDFGNSSYLHNDFFAIESIDYNDFKEAVKKLKPKKAAGTDGIPPYILKGCSEWLIEPMVHIFNRLINSKVFPTIWKTAVTTPIHKSGTLQNIENYRPIAIMCAPAKLFEQIIHNKLYSYIIEKYIMSQQPGFVLKKS
uniref:Uncharacterized protein LOC114347395 n=1 Tax=Diabrotica virgifera virgifera TaxID=50390 RepID=A0A6P7HDR1_DIAVI